MPKPLEVVPIEGERMCFYVHSRSNPRKVYRVDALSYAGRSECHCPSYRINFRKRAEAGEWASCIHVEAMRLHVMRQTFVAMAAADAEPATVQRRQR